MQNIENESFINLLKRASFFGELSKTAYEKASPLSALFELTPRCNFACKMCYVRLSNGEISQFGRELTTAEWINIAEQARNMGVLNLGLTGGEPLLREDFGEIYSALAQMGFLITIQTNCSLMDDMMMALFDRYPPDEIKTTLYGATDETYENVCGVKGGLARVLDGIKKVQKTGINLSVVATAVKDNWQEMEKVYAMAAGLGIRLYHTNRIMPHTRKPSGSASDTAVLFSDLSQTEQETISEHGRKFTSPLQRCKVYRTGFWVLWDGRLSLCAHLLEPTFSLLEMNLKTGWENLIEELARLYPQDSCTACSMNDACNQCPATVQTKEPFTYTSLCENLTKERRMLIDGSESGLPCDM